jgi:hypothetical protein
MTKLMKKFGAFALMVAGSIGLATKHASAAADPQLTSSLASTTDLLKDNAFAFIPYILGIFGAVIVLTLIIKGIMWGIKKIKGTIK